jgi:tripartite-type tricarboxylate transporter receptor subunit TctC
MLDLSARRHAIARPVTALAAVTAVPSLAAEAPAACPTRPVRLIVPFTPGGSTDILARAIGQRLTEAWGQAVVADNRPGAGGIIGMQTAAKSAPDGYKLVMGHIGTLAANPALYKSLPYDPVKIVAKLNADAVKALHDTSVADRLAAEGADPVGNSSDEFSAFIKSEIELWGKVIRATGAKPE